MSSIFGTDGIRGLVNKFPITADIALIIGTAIGIFIGANNSKRRVVIAKDSHPESAYRTRIWFQERTLCSQ